MRAISFILFGVLVSCLEFIPERIDVTYVNPKFLRHYRAYVRRAGRRQPYVIHNEFSLIHTLGHNTSTHILFFEYLHNEYKQSFIELEFKGCDSLKDVYFGTFMRRHGMECPIRAGNYTFNNLTFLNIPAVDNLPYKWPFEKGKITATALFTPKKEIIAQGDVFFIVKQTKRKH